MSEAGALGADRIEPVMVASGACTVASLAHSTTLQPGTVTLMASGGRPGGHINLRAAFNPSATAHPTGLPGPGATKHHGSGYDISIVTRLPNKTKKTMRVGHLDTGEAISHFTFDVCPSSPTLTLTPIGQAIKAKIEQQEGIPTSELILRYGNYIQALGS